MSTGEELPVSELHEQIQQTQARLRESILEARTILERTEEMIRRLSVLLRDAQQPILNGAGEELQQNGRRDGKRSRPRRP